MMDPPWQLATANPTRGVALGYSQVRVELVTIAGWPGSGLSADLQAAVVQHAVIPAPCTVVPSPQNLHASLPGSGS